MMKAFSNLLLSSVVLLGTATLAIPAAKAAPQAPLAPPVSQPSSGLWHWQDIPRDERIPIVRATFDQTGYFLTDSNGQVISVPFVGNNLYVMRFGKTGGDMFFVNEGGQTPVLYLPNDAYLENATVAGARWYPFPQQYYYVRPVFLGPAPSWDAYVTMGWYPGMVYYGGFWGYDPWRVGITYRPLPGLYVTVGGRSCFGWDNYVYFYRSTPVRRVVFVDCPPPRQTVIVRRDYRDYGRDFPVRRTNERGGFSNGSSRNDSFHYNDRATSREAERGGGFRSGGERSGNTGGGNGSGFRYSEPAGRDREYRVNRDVSGPPQNNTNGGAPREYRAPVGNGNGGGRGSESPRAYRTPSNGGGQYTPPSGGGSRERGGSGPAPSYGRGGGGSSERSSGGGRSTSGPSNGGGRSGRDRERG